MIREELVSYALAFASFLLQSDVAKKIDRIILFGSVSRGDFNKESDIDIFVDSLEDIEKDVYKELYLFLKSEVQKRWELKGLKHEISLKIGKLDEWTPLKRSIVSNGIILYGKFKEAPDKMEHYNFFEISFDNFKRKKKIMLWRKLYGYRQKVNGKEYKKEGLVYLWNAKRLEKGLIVPAGKSKEANDFLHKEKINYTIREVWSDNV